MCLAEHDYVIEAFATNRSNDPLSMAVLPSSPESVNDEAFSAFHVGPILLWPKSECPRDGLVRGPHRGRHTQKISAAAAIRLRCAVEHFDQSYGLGPVRIQAVKTPEAIGLDGLEPRLPDKALIAQPLQHRAPDGEVRLADDLLDAQAPWICHQPLGYAHAVNRPDRPPVRISKRGSALTMKAILRIAL